MPSSTNPHTPHPSGPHATDRPDPRPHVLDRATRTLPEIEAATLRLVALRQAGSVLGAARRLGMSHTALSQWLGRRMFGGKR